jgi:hypothetical protein
VRRDEHRTKCIEAIKICHQTFEIGYFSDFQAARILDSLDGVARVVPIEATEEMLAAARREVDDLCERGPGEYADLYCAMSAAGDLTNPPENKP